MALAKPQSLFFNNQNIKINKGNYFTKNISWKYFTKIFYNIFYQNIIKYILLKYYINNSRIRSKGFRFTLGVWGLRVCSLDVAFTVATVRNRPQPSATVRRCSRDPRMAVPMGSSAEVVFFWGCRRVVALFRVAGVALRDIQTCSGTCRKSF